MPDIFREQFTNAFSQRCEAAINVILAYPSRLLIAGNLLCEDYVTVNEVHPGS